MPELMLNGAEGRLEARYNPGKTPNAPVALVLHPHPRFNDDPATWGSMNTKVTYVTHQLFAKMGFATLRFNFRGVGKSQGEYDKGEGELADAAAMLDWLQAQNPDASYTFVSGFSFGAWICMQLLMRRPEIDRFIAVAPPAGKYDFSFLAPCPTSGMIITGDRDQVVPEPSVRTLASKLKKQKKIDVQYTVVEGVDHFFNGHLEKLVNHMQAYIKSQLQPNV